MLAYSNFDESPYSRISLVLSLGSSKFMFHIGNQRKIASHSFLTFAAHPAFRLENCTDSTDEIKIQTPILEKTKRSFLIQKQRIPHVKI